MMNLLTEDMLRDPYPLYAQLRRDAPVLHHPDADLYAIFDYDGVRRALGDPDSFGSAVAGGLPARWLIFQDAPRHTKLRALVSRAFTSRAVGELEPRVRRISARLLDEVAPRTEMDLVAEYAVPLPLIVIASMLGAPTDDVPLFRRWSDDILGLVHTIGGGEAGARAEQAFAVTSDEMARYVGELVRARRARPEDDLLTRLVKAEVDGARLSNDEILGFFQLLLLAGHETTTNLIANAVLCLLEHPEARAAASSPDRVPALVEEVLRYRSPVQAVFRITKRDVDLRGARMPEGKLVLAVIGSANRDEVYFADAARFDVARDPNPHIAFGHGTHFCLGAMLARLEARVAIPDLVTRLGGLALASDAPWTPRAAFHVHGPSRLPVRFERSARRTA